ncbi:uncharacterized protein LOC141599533 [Silene latifolia]|uniref:uncharacterized protein LOC141599533 n=1 Tax=Silene latifolia TaxID=37657 RepID=UPI003D76E0EA
MSTDHQDDLDLLLSLQDRVLETPPSSPSSRPVSLDYQSDDDERRRPSGNVDLSDFRSAVEDCMDYDVETATKALKSNHSKNTKGLDLEKFSGLRIRNQVLSSTELSNQFSDIRFVRLSAIKNLIKGDTLSGCWATIGVLTEKGSPKMSSTGKSYCIWKIGCLDGESISVFLFGDAYKTHSKEPASTAFAFFNATVRKDTSGPGFQLSVFNANQILKVGTSVDYGVCKGRRKDGMPCTMVVNKRLGIYCSYHRVKTSEKYTATRGELKGGNLRTAFRNPYQPYQPEGIYMVDRMADRANNIKGKKPTKVLSVDGLKKALSNAGKVTSNAHSQGIRFLNEITVSMSAGTAKKECIQKSAVKSDSLKRSHSQAKPSSSISKTSTLPDSKRVRVEPRQVKSQKAEQTSKKIIELDDVSSDDDILFL